MVRNLDDIQAELKKEKQGLERLEDRYYAQRREIDEAYLDLDDRRKELETIYEETYNAVSSYLHQQEGDVSEQYYALNRLIEDYSEATETQYKKYYREISDKEETLTSSYYKERAQVEDNNRRSPQPTASIIWLREEFTLEVSDVVSAVFAGNEGSKAAKKEIDKAVIKNISAPLKKRKRRKIVSDYDGQIEQAAATIKSSLTTIKGQLDTAIKGKGRKAIEKAIKEHSNKYDDI